MKITRTTNTDAGFYEVVGPILSRRDIVSELGGPVWDEDEKVWWLAIDGGQLVGFCAALPIAGGWRLCSDYVVPTRRGSGIYSTLFDARLEFCRGLLQAVATEASLQAFLRHGFSVAGKRGRYTLVRQDTAEVTA